MRISLCLIHMRNITCDCWAITSAVAGATEEGMPGAMGGPGPINPGKPQSIDLSIDSKLKNLLIQLGSSVSVCIYKRACLLTRANDRHGAIAKGLKIQYVTLWSKLISECVCRGRNL
jgi:hypothetical protein